MDVVDRGSSIELTLQLEGAAPASGTRVFLHADGEEAIFARGAVPRVISVQPNFDRIIFRVPTLPSPKVGTATITAVAINGRHEVTIKVR
jgi:hypothetical protein